MASESNKAEPVPSLRVGIWLDIFLAAVVASGTLAAWYGVYYFFGDPAKLNTSFITFLGGVLAISGLLFRQYMLKEVLDYIKTWEKMDALLISIIESAACSENGDNAYARTLVAQQRQAAKYSKYVRQELSLVPVIPLALIFLYGCALLSENSVQLRAGSLFSMIFCVSYLAIAALSSTRLASAQPDLTETVAELEELRHELGQGRPTKNDLHADAEETAYLLRSPKSASRLLGSVAELEGGKGTERKLAK